MKSIRSKLLGVVFFIIVILSATSVSIYIMHIVVVEKYKAISNKLITEYKLIASTSDLIDAYNKEYRDPSAQNEKAINDLKTKINVNIKLLDVMIVDKHSIADYTGLKNVINEILSNVDMGLRDILMGNNSSISAHYDIARLHYDYVKEDGMELITDELQYSESVQNQINLFYQASVMVGGTVILITGLGSILYILAFSKKIVVPIRKLKSTAEQIAQGNLGTIINKDLLRQEDEIGNLANSISVMVQELNKRINNENLAKNKVEQLLSDSIALQKIIREEGDKVRGIITSMREGLIVLDKELKIVLINPAAEKLLEVNGQPTVGKRIVEILPKIFKNGLESPSSRPSTNTLTGEPVSITVDDNISFGLISGKQFPVAVSTTPLREERGEITGMVEVFRDITAEIQSRLVIEQQVVERTKELLEKNAALAAAKEEINHAWQQIQLEKTQFLASINSISIGFVMFNDVGKVLHLNPAFSKIVNAKQPFATVNEIDVLLGNAFSIKEKFEKCRSTEQKIDISGIEINGKDYSVHLAPIFATDNSFTVIGVVLLIEA